MSADTILSNRRSLLEADPSSSISQKPQKRNKLSNYLYDKQNKTCCKRTFCGWIKIICFVTIFTVIIIGAAFLALYLTYSNFLQRDGPFFDKFSGNPVNPGLSFFPNINKGSSVIWYSTTKSEKGYRKIKDYTDDIKWKLKDYTNEYDNSSYTVDCDRPDYKNNAGDFCMFNRESLGDCSSGSFGYEEMQPCFYLKINKIPTWTPLYFSKVLPKMPDQLKKMIKSNNQKKRLWLNCEGKRPADVEHMGIIDYYPYEGFSGHYFPHPTIHNYISPLVGVKFRNLTKGYMVSIKCSLWAQNFIENQLSIHVYVE